LSGCFDDIYDFKKFFELKGCSVTDLIFKIESKEATLSKDDFLKVLNKFYETLNK